MERTVCELFAGVGGFRCGLNHIHDVVVFEESKNLNESWKTTWFNQWEPLDKRTQYAHSCYIYHFGDCPDLDGNYHTNDDINLVDKTKIPDHNLLVGGFPCQDYSVAGTLSTSKGIEGKKGVLWWSIREILETKETPFVLLENVDRLIKSPASQRGRDFGIILTCLRDLGYIVEWRVINAAEYGFQQRRRRTFIFAARDNTEYAKNILKNINSQVSLENAASGLIAESGFFASIFPVESSSIAISRKKLDLEIGEVSDKFSFSFENSGIMLKNNIFTAKTKPIFNGPQITLGDILETETTKVNEDYFIPLDRLYYDINNPTRNHTDESEERMAPNQRRTWQYIKGAKKYPRESKTGYKYFFTEGAIPMVDSYDKPARTMLTSEGSFSRTTHIVKDKKTGNIRLLTSTETERIQGFPTDHTKLCRVGDNVLEMPDKKRRFMMGNALVVNLVEQMEPKLSEIFANEGQEAIYE